MHKGGVAMIEHHDVFPDVGSIITIQSLSNRIESVEECQKNHTRTIHRIEDKLDKMVFLHYAELTALIGVLVTSIIAMSK